MRLQIDEMFDRINVVGERIDWEQDYETLSGPQQVFRSVWNMNAEIQNGGFWQYFWNSSGELVPHILTSLHSIEAHGVTAIVAQAIEVIGPLPWTDTDARRAAMDVRADEIENSLNALDDAYCAKIDDLILALHNYATRHATELNFPA
jgi:hypothetical protein